MEAWTFQSFGSVLDHYVSLPAIHVPLRRSCAIHVSATSIVRHLCFDSRFILFRPRVIALRPAAFCSGHIVYASAIPLLIWPRARQFASTACQLVCAHVCLGSSLMCSGPAFICLASALISCFIRCCDDMLWYCDNNMFRFHLNISSLFGLRHLCFGRVPLLFGPTSIYFGPVLI